MPNQSQLDPVTGISRPPLHPGTSVEAIRAQANRLFVFSVVLVLCFSKPLFDLLRFALHSELFSHVLLIPFISGYLIWLQKDSLPSGAPVRSRALIFWVLGLGVLLGSLFANHVGFLVRADRLTGFTFSFLLFFVGNCFFCFGPQTLRAVVFPLGFLVFMVPFPGFIVESIESFLQHTSALGADWFFSLTGMSFVRDGLVFQLPGIRLEVAPECSGIHSSLVLFITSVLAGQLFLQSPWKRALLALVVIPLGIVRNAFRIWVIGELCVHVSPAMINSWIHRRGGPVFFVLSLFPLFLLLLYLRKSEQKRQCIGAPPESARRS